jgi:hypothetical protein
MRQVTRGTVKALEGKAPGACASDRRILSALARCGDIFENFTPPQREELWSRACGSSKRRLIPSLFTFFEDRKFLNDAAGCIKKILDLGRRDTIAGSLEETFSDANQQKDRCIIQLSETSFGSVEGDIDARLDFGIRQLWLAAFRHCKELPVDAQKNGLLALPRTHTDETALHELASLASRLGFESDKLCKILQTPSDRNLAEHVLSRARKPGRYVFRDRERCIQQILDAFAAAVPAPAGEATDETVEELRELEQPPKRYGRPNDVDYEYDKVRLFLPQMDDAVDAAMGDMTSTFVRWSVCSAYFGSPPTLGSVDCEDLVEDDIAMACSVPGESEQPDDNGRRTTMGNEDVILAITRQEIELEKARHRDVTTKVQAMEAKLGTLAQDERSQQTRIQENDEQIRDQNARLENLRQETALEEERLNRLKGITDVMQSRGGEVEEKEREEEEEEGEERHPDVRMGGTLISSDPVSQAASEEPRQRTPSPPGSQEDETQVVQWQTNRRTHFNFRELMEYDPNKERQEMLASGTGADGADAKVRINFAHAESPDSFVICDALEVDPKEPEDVSQVLRLATKYMRKGYGLFDRERNRLNAADCFHKVVDDGSHMIVLDPIPHTW